MSTGETAFRVAGLDNRLRRIALITRLTDTAIPVPGTDVKLGLDAVIGAVPVVGDVAMAAVALVLVHDAHQLGVPKADVARMLRNVALDMVIGAVPFVGDLFDLVFRANERNLRLLERHVGRIDAPVLEAMADRRRG